MQRSRAGLAPRTVAVAVAFLILGLIAGRALGPAPAPAPASSTPAAAEVWTCSMHPQIKLPGPGDCPICGMPLIRAGGGGGGDGTAPVLTLSEHARAMASVATEVVTRKPLSHEIRVVGLVEYNETAVATVTARVDGFVERLFVDYTGVDVNRGDHLVELYSPDLVAAQHEMLVALEAGGSVDMLESVRTKLLRWGILPEQIDQLVKERKAQERMNIYSPVAGTVIEKAVVEKSSVKTGDVLYRLVNLDSVWVNLDVYEFELGWIQYGQKVEITAEAFPGRSFSGLVVFVSPIVDRESRTIKVRVNVANQDRLLKPGMFVSARGIVPLLSDGSPRPTGVGGKFVCPMHPEVIQDGPGSCPRCSMPLEQLPESTHPVVPAAAEQQPLAVPASAVLDSGEKHLVYVEQAPGEYRPVEVVLGPRTRDEHPVISGLKEGDRVVVRGNFLLDSQAQIQGLPSLLTPTEERRKPVDGAPRDMNHAGSAGSAGSTMSVTPLPSTTGEAKP